MDIFQWINHLIHEYITIDVILVGLPIILLSLVCWTFWGKSWVMEQVSKVGKEQRKKGWLE